MFMQWDQFLAAKAAQLLRWSAMGGMMMMCASGVPVFTENDLRSFFHHAGLDAGVVFIESWTAVFPG